MPYVEPTISDFRTRFPALSSISDTDVTAALLIAHDFVDQVVWPEGVWERAILYLAAHIASIQQKAAITGGAGGGGTGTLEPGTLYTQSIQAEGRQVSYGIVPGSAAQSETVVDVSPTAELLRQTLYGRLFLNLRNQVVMPIVVVGPDPDLPPIGY